jgi:hypothetical protein
VASADAECFKLTARGQQLTILHPAMSHVLEHQISGTLTVTDGTHTARLAMIGSYVAANFVLTDDTHGGTLVGDPPVDSSGHMTSPHP